MGVMMVIIIMGVMMVIIIMMEVKIVVMEVITLLAVATLQVVITHLVAGITLWVQIK
jgi:hypothetical protein